MDPIPKTRDIVARAAKAVSVKSKINLRSFPESQTITAALPGQSAELFHKINMPIQSAARFAIYIWNELRASALWISNLPHQVVHFFTWAGNEVGRAAVFVAKVALGSIVGLALLGITIQICSRMWPIYKRWRLKIKAQRADEEQERAYLLEDEERRREAQRDSERAAKEENNRLERAHKEREVREQKKAEEKQRRQEDHQKYRLWTRECNSIFQPYKTSLTRFPEPPHWPCDKVECSLRHRYLKACEHSLYRLFEATGDMRTTLVFERNRWHPNGTTGSKFHRSPGNLHDDEVRKKAVELSQVLQKMIEAEKDI